MEEIIQWVLAGATVVVALAATWNSVGARREAREALRWTRQLEPRWPWWTVIISGRDEVDLVNAERDLHSRYPEHDIMLEDQGGLTGAGWRRYQIRAAQLPTFVADKRACPRCRDDAPAEDSAGTAPEETLRIGLGEGERLVLTARPGNRPVLVGTMRDGRLMLDEGKVRSGVDMLRPPPPPPPEFYDPPLSDPVVPDWTPRPRCHLCGARRHWLFGICFGSS